MIRSSSTRFFATVAAVVALFGLSGSVRTPLYAAKHSSKLDRELQRKIAEHAGGAVRVIVTPAPGRHDTVRRKFHARGDALGSDYTITDSFAATVPAAELTALDHDPDVAGVSLDAIVRAGSISGEESGAAGSALFETLGLVDATLTGKDVGIAVIDSGLERGPDLGGGDHGHEYDFTDGGRAVAPYDDYGHGTHVAGLIGGSGDASKTRREGLGRDGKLHGFDVLLYPGVAPHARIISLKVLDSNGAGLTSRVIDAIEFAVRNKDRLKIDVINLSLGHPIYESAATDPLVQAVEAAVRAGIVVVAAAGNVGLNPETGAPGYAGITSPGNAPSAITVGAVDTKGTASRLDDDVAPYSSRGPTWYDGEAKPDIVAPGHRLVAAAALHSSLFEQLVSRRVGLSGKPARYLRLSGTSMATAVTTGVVALMLEAHNARFKEPLSPNAVKAFLEFSAIPLAGVDVLTQGAGSLNADGAIALASSADTSSPVGDWWLSQGVDPWSTIDGVAYTWGQTEVWGNTVVWGNMAYYNLDAWAQTVVWGNTVVWSNTVVWGNTADVVWTDPESWASTVVWGNALLDPGATTDGAVDWESVGPTTVVWGNLAKQ